jgi:pyrroloquinoline-quinone synthase
MGLYSDRRDVVTTIHEIDADIRARHLLKHPFYSAWSRGEIPLSTLAEYARQYYQFESNFPRYVGATYAQLTDPSQRRVLLENLMDEEGRPPTHPELWLDFAASVGASSRSVQAARPSESMQHLLNVYERATLKGTAPSGLGALYAYESIFPEVAAEKSRGLRDHYSIRSRAAHEFFRVHSFADMAHSAAERRVMQSLMRQSPEAGIVMRGEARRSMRAWWSFLDSFGIAP